MKGQRSVIKDILFSLIIFIIFFVALEVQQRVRQYWKTGNEYYLFYGGDRASLFLKKIYYNTRILCRINIDIRRYQIKLMWTGWDFNPQPLGCPDE